MGTFQPVTASQWIEEILEQHPKAQEFLRENGIVCVMCGEPVWGSLAEQMDGKGFDAAKQEKLLAALNDWLRTQET